MNVPPHSIGDYFDVALCIASSIQRCILFVMANKYCIFVDDISSTSFLKLNLSRTNIYISPLAYSSVLSIFCPNPNPPDLSCAMVFACLSKDPEKRKLILLVSTTFDASLSSGNSVPCMTLKSSDWTSFLCCSYLFHPFYPHVRAVWDLWDYYNS